MQSALPPHRSPMPTQTSSWEQCLDIPELLDQIALLLKRKDFLACTLVSRRWHQLWIRPLFSTLPKPGSAPFFVKYGSFVRTYSSSDPEDLALARLHCWNISELDIITNDTASDIFWTGFLALDAPTQDFSLQPPSPASATVLTSNSTSARTSILSTASDPKDAFNITPTHAQDKIDYKVSAEEQEMTVEQQDIAMIASLSGTNNSFLSDSIRSLRLQVSDPQMVVRALVKARTHGRGVLQNLTAFKLINSGSSLTRQALQVSDIIALLDAFPLLDRLAFLMVDIIDNRSKDEGVSTSLHGMTPRAYNLRTLHLPQFASVTVLSQILGLFPRLKTLYLRQDWYPGTFLQDLRGLCPELEDLRNTSRLCPEASTQPPNPPYSTPSPPQGGTRPLQSGQGLKKLSFLFSNDFEDALKILFEDHGGTLEEVKIRSYLHYNRETPSFALHSIEGLFRTSQCLKRLHVHHNLLPLKAFTPPNLDVWACAKSLKELNLWGLIFSGLDDNRILQRTLASLTSLQILTLRGTGIWPEAILDGPDEAGESGMSRGLVTTRYEQLSTMDVELCHSRGMTVQELEKMLSMLPRLRSLDIHHANTKVLGDWLRSERPDIQELQ